ncbi:MAG TPA: hypothetical protein VF077_08950 [Nitrospiraceae bacterium]
MRFLERGDLFKPATLETKIAHKLRLCAGSGIFTAEECAVIMTVLSVRKLTSDVVKQGFLTKTAPETLLDQLFEPQELPHG